MDPYKSRAVLHGLFIPVEPNGYDKDVGMDQPPAQIGHLDPQTFHNV